MNEIKYNNYKEQAKRLKKALENQFYLEAIFIEYSILEDRADAILRYAKQEIISDRYVSIDRKLTKIKNLSLNKCLFLNKYFNEEFIMLLKEWKEKRNPLIHALMKRSNSRLELEKLALDGQELMKIFARKSMNYKNFLIRRNLL